MTTTASHTATNKLTATDYALFRETARRFCEQEVIPNIQVWEKARTIPLDWWRRAGEAGLLCVEIGET